MKRDCKQAEQETPPWATPEQFIEVWQTSGTLREVCSRLRMRRAAVKVRAYRYRQRGVPLKQHDVDPAVELLPDWQALAKYATELVAPGGNAPAAAPGALTP